MNMRFHLIVLHRIDEAVPQFHKKPRHHCRGLGKSMIAVIKVASFLPQLPMNLCIYFCEAGNCR